MKDFTQNGALAPTVPRTSAQPHSGPVWDFLTATRDPATLRRIRDDHPDFDLEQVRSAEEAALLVWRLRVQLDVSSVQEGKELDEVVSNALEALADVAPEARDALAWLENPDKATYKPSEAPTIARRLVEQWQRVPRYEVFTFADLKGLKRVQWLVRGFLVQCTVSTLSADSGGFKSFLALELALCIATGTPFFGRETTQGAVVYVAAEGFYTILERALAWAQVRGISLPANFHILRAPVNVADTLALAEFIATVEEFEPVFIVLDTLSQNAIGLNENSNDEMALFMAGMARLGTHIGAHVMAVHHNAKASGTFRGAGAIKANVDTHVTLERPEGDETNTVFVRCEKQRGREFDSFALRGEEVEIEGISDEYGDAITSLVFEPCGDAVTAKPKHPNAKKADKTRGRLLEVFDEIAGEWKGEVKAGTWQARANEAGICTSDTFYRHLKALAPENGSGPIAKGDGVYRRTPTTPTTPTTEKRSYRSDGTNHDENNSYNSYNPLGVGVVGVNGGSAGNGKKSAHKKTAQSEPYAAPVAHDDDSIFDDEPSNEGVAK